MNLPEYQQLALFAPDPEEIELPGLVRTITNPIIVSEDNEVLMDTFSYLSLDYTRMIPLLVAGVNELDAAAVKYCEPTTLPGRLAVFYDTNKTLCASRLIDDGERAGVNATDSSAAFNVTTDTDSIGVRGKGLITGSRFRGALHGVIGLAEGSSYDADVYAGVAGICENAPEANTGTAGFAMTATSAANLGVMGLGIISEELNAGIAGLGGSHYSGEGDLTEALNMGVVGIANNSHNENRAGFFRVSGCETCDTSLHIAVYGQVDTDDTLATYYAGYFEGDVTITGTLINPSDRELKKNIEDIDNALETIMRLQPREYEYKADEYRNMTLSRVKKYGLIAEELEEALPELVHNIRHPAQWKPAGKTIKGEIEHPQMSYKGIDYIGLIPLGKLSK